MRIKSRARKAAAHRRSVKAREELFQDLQESVTSYINQTTGEEALVIVMFLSWYLRLRRRVEDSGVHLSYVVANKEKITEYPTDSQTMCLSLLAECDEWMAKKCKERF